ncbi:hypothetical protein E2C01_035520 [Portunus trituberculatus]|uniref:Uncharacterized protein n=1 Tax=Portunus trituberculatus TaxID=210409 RepID=A0A5B7F3D6_PORTR|nr:hypothetical protein [Portunus trituberculatus]
MDRAIITSGKLIFVFKKARGRMCVVQRCEVAGRYMVDLRPQSVGTAPYVNQLSDYLSAGVPRMKVEDTFTDNFALTGQAVQ